MSMLRGVERAVTEGGPFDGYPGEVIAGTDALTMSGGAYVYRRTGRTTHLPDEADLEEAASKYAARWRVPYRQALTAVAASVRTRPYQVFEYDPDVSPGHAAAVRADAEAVQEVADREGTTVAAVLARAAAAKTAAAGREHPAALLLAEAARRGVDPAVLIAEHAARQMEGARP